MQSVFCVAVSLSEWADKSADVPSEGATKRRPPLRDAESDGRYAGGHADAADAEFPTSNLHR